MPAPTPIYLHATAAIAPATDTAGSRRRAAEPDYAALLDPRLIRRMSRVVKMGAGAAMACLREAAVEMPGAIVTGTAYGCTEDTEAFLQKLVAQNEELLTPTAFIQSTHNTIGAQIALLLRCHAYNNTFVHRAFAFEHALLDAMLLLEEGEAATALVGGVDELEDVTFQILHRFGLFKKSPSARRGTTAGEGAAFFLLGTEKTERAFACLRGVATFYRPDDMTAEVENFLAGQGLAAADIGLLLTGKNGDEACDQVYDRLAGALFPATPAAVFKNTCGEYPTATAFALWQAAQALRSPTLPARNVLIYNHFYNIHHSLILLSAC